jgi:hypothetical protein
VTRLRQSYTAAGPLRQALLIIVLAGTILNAWTAIDAQFRLPKLVTATEIEAEVATEHENLKNWPPAISHEPDFEISRYRAMAQYGSEVESRIAAEREALRKRPSQIFTIWETAAKLEFGILAGAVCVWLLLGRTNAPRRES